MFEILPESAGSLACVRLTSKVTDEDLKAALPKLEAVINDHGSLRLLADIEHFDGWEWVAAWDKTAFGIKHWDEIEKLAVIGASRWEALCAAIADKLTNSEVKFFSPDQRDAAKAWID